MTEIMYKKVSELRKGMYVIYENDLWRIEDIKTSVAGKHGAAKARIKLRSFLEGKSKEIVLSTEDRMQVPNITKRRGQVIAIVEYDEEGKPKTAQVMDLETYETYDMIVHEDVKDRIEEGRNVIYWDVLGKKVIVQTTSE